jgi:glucoamylase
MLHPAAGCDAATFQPCSDKALANLKVYVDSFRNGVYPINNGISANQAIAVGRYVEDIYFNGNPWYLTTLAVAEQLYRAIYTLDALKSGIQVTAISLPFYHQFLPSLRKPTTIAADYTTILNSIKNFADGFVAIVAEYTPADGGLAEQFTKDTGAPLSAVDLTWSYASALTAIDARANVPVESWGAGGLAVPTVCGTNPGPMSTLTFEVHAETIFGGGSLFLSLDSYQSMY